MKKSFLACSILLAAAGCSANEGGLSAANSEAITSQASLAGDTFLSKDAYTTNDYQGKPVQAKLRMKFTRADGGYTLDDADTGLDYEATIEWVNVATGEVYAIDSSFFARQGAKSSKYDFFDCDSTSKCSTSYMTDLTVDESGNATLTNNHLFSIFWTVTGAPATVDFQLVK